MGNDFIISSSGWKDSVRLLPCDSSLNVRVLCVVSAEKKGLESYFTALETTSHRVWQGGSDIVVGRGCSLTLPPALTIPSS